MNKPTVRQVTIGSVIAALAGSAIAWQQIGEVFTMKVPHDLIHASENYVQQEQIIDVQIIQQEIQLETIEDRKKANKPRDGDENKEKRILDRIKRLEKTQEEMRRK